MNIFTKILDTIFPSGKGHWKPVTLDKATVFRRMKSWQREAVRSEEMRLHPSFAFYASQTATYYRDLLEEMQLLGTDTITAKEWVVDEDSTHRQEL